MNIPFLKMHGLGNDFIILDQRNGALALKDIPIQEMSDRHRGIGCDQFILLLPASDPTCQADLRIFNQDGSEAEACGNATRCVVAFLSQVLGVAEVRLQSVAGCLTGTVQPDGRVEVFLPPPKFTAAEIPVCATEAQHIVLSAEKMQPWGIGAGFCVNVGNPHIVFFVKDVACVPVAEIGPMIEVDPLFPEKINVEFVEVLGRSEVKMRVWERGAGETQACGTGACASVIAGICQGYLDETVTVGLTGGALQIHWQKDAPIQMIGGATFVYQGVWGSPVLGD